MAICRVELSRRGRTQAGKFSNRSLSASGVEALLRLAALKRSRRMAALDRKQFTLGFYLLAEPLKIVTLPAERRTVQALAPALDWDENALTTLSSLITRVLQMAEIRQLDRVQPRRPCSPPSTSACGPHAAGTCACGFFRSFKQSGFWAIVGVPTLVAGVYFFSASPQDLYPLGSQVSSWRQPETGAGERDRCPASVHRVGTSGGTTTAAVQEFVMSRDAVSQARTEQ